MEYVIAHTTHPKHLTLGLPGAVARRIGFDPKARDQADTSRSISFLSRGAGIARVVTTYAVREALAIETLRGRLIASARPARNLVFAFPIPLAKHLRLDRTPRPGRPRGTDDTILWFLPASEYYESQRGAEPEGHPAGQATGGLAHVYLTKSVIPLPKEFGQLAETEARIEQEEWRPGVEAIQRAVPEPRTKAV